MNGNDPVTRTSNEGALQAMREMETASGREAWKPAAACVMQREPSFRKMSFPDSESCPPEGRGSDGGGEGGNRLDAVEGSNAEDEGGFPNSSNGHLLSSIPR